MAAKLETTLVHGGEPEPRIRGAVALPIFQSSTYLSGAAEEGHYHDIRYVRLSNSPNHEVLHRKLALLEGGEAALVTSSGMAAIATSLLTILSSGDHILLQRGVYGGTHAFALRELKDFGVAVDFIDAGDPSSWERSLRPTTRAIYVEAMTNPLLQVADLDAVVAFARAHRLVSLIDSTFASPVNFRPIERGFDLCLHSATKYMNGHNDLGAGAVIGSTSLIKKIKERLDHLGGVLDPHACFLLHRGLKTLALRVRHQNESALRIARFLSEQPSVARVHYAGLESHKDHARARKLFAGFGGVLSFEPRGGEAAALRLLDRLKIPLRAPSLGGVETLITLPAKTSHAGLSPREREELGITDGLIRLSVGIEATEDLLEDFRQALDADAEKRA